MTKRGDSTTILTAMTAAAGALAAGSAAQAQTVFTQVDQFVGFTGGVATAPYDFSIAGGFGFNIGTSQFPIHSTGGAAFPTFIVQASSNHSSYFKMKTFVSNPTVGATFQRAAPAGGASTWATNSNNAVSIADFLIQQGSTSANATQQYPVPSGTQYFLFQFGTGVPGQPDYGWLAGTLQDAGTGNFGIQIDTIAYNTDHSFLATPPSVPEPASAGLLALGALVSGAAGTRRFKRGRVTRERPAA